MTDEHFDAAIQKMNAGEKEGLREIYDAYADEIYSFFLSRVHLSQDAEDLTSDFFLKIWECAGAYRPGHGHKCWLITIARNMATDFLRKAAHSFPVEDAETTFPAALVEDTSAEETAEARVQTEYILSLLPEEEREIVRMHLALEMTFREIAATLHRPLGTVSWKYRGAITRLQTLAKEGRL